MSLWYTVIQLLPRSQVAARQALGGSRIWLEMYGNFWKRDRVFGMRPLELKVRELMEQKLNVKLPETRLVIGVGTDGRERYHKFDGVSADRQTVIAIKSNELKANNRYDSAIKQALVYDLYMLSRISAKTKMLIITDQALFERCRTDMDGKLALDTTIEYCRVD